MTIEHRDIQDPELHEPKGASTALEGQVYVADGVGSGVWETPQPLGTFQILSEFTAASLVDQNPAGLDSPLQITYGPAQTTPDIDMDVNGNITVNTSGVYEVRFSGRFGRTTGAGTAALMARYLVNGVKVPYTTAEELDDGNFSIPLSISGILNLVEGQVLTTQIMRDGAGANNGGLLAFTPNDADWAPVPSSVIRINRLGVA